MDRITDGPDMTSAVDRGRKASRQTKNILVDFILVLYSYQICSNFVTGLNILLGWL